MNNAQRNRNPWLILLAGTLVVFGALGLARFGYTVVLPAMQRALVMDNTQAGMLASVNLAGYLAMSAAGGALASRFGSRVVTVAGLVIAGGGMLLTATAHGFADAALWRCLTGVGSGAANIAVMGMWSSVFPPHKRGMAAGIAVTGSSLGLIFTGPVVPYLLKNYGASGWQAAWLVFGVVTLAVALLAWLVIHTPGKESGIDLSIAYGGTGSGGKKEGLSWGLVYRSTQVWHLGLVYSACGFSYIIFMTFFIKRLVVEGGFTREAAGNLFMLMGWASLVCGLLWGMVSDRIGRKWALCIVYLIHVSAFSLFAVGGKSCFLVAALLFGISAWSIPAIMAAACGDVLGPRLAPAALGFITLFFGVGQALGPGIAGMIADRAGSFAPAYFLAAGIALLGALGAATLRPVIASPPDKS